MPCAAPWSRWASSPPPRSRPTRWSSDPSPEEAERARRAGYESDGDLLIGRDPRDIWDVPEQFGPDRLDQPPLL
jgi:hypothetical protein